MANTIIIKNGAGAPPNDALAVAELGFDTENKKLYIGHKDGIVDLNSSGVTIDLEGAEQGNVASVNADTLGGVLAEEYATKDYVAEECVTKDYIAEEYATKDYVNTIVNETLEVIENGSY